jgi:hypothetical protein
MVKPTTIPVLYRFGESKVEILPYFLYEVTIYKIFKDRAVLLDSALYKACKLLSFKKEVKSKHYKNYSIVKTINLLGVTQDFVDENHLPKYEPIKSKNKPIKSNKK